MKRIFSYTIGDAVRLLFAAPLWAVVVLCLIDYYTIGWLFR